jgi:2-deoxy-D-gluconate 3-dehydrogenase
MAEALLEAGAEVALCGTTERVLELAASYRDKKYACHGVIADLADLAGVEQAYADAVSRLGRSPDILVNAAGIQRRHPCTEFPFAEWRQVLDINLDAVFILCQLAGRDMIRQGSGKIINVASMLSFFGGYTVPAYAASKGGVTQLTKALANEWSGQGVQVNAIAPGYMDTDMNIRLKNDPERNSEILRRIPAGRWGTPADMKGITIFLASAASDYVCGAVIPVDGGYLGR